MREAWRILGLIATIMSICGVGGLAGLYAALTDWNWRSATSESHVPMPDEAASPGALGHTEEGQTYVVKSRAVGVESLSAGNAWHATPLPLPADQPWYLAGLTASIFPLDDTRAAFDPTASQPWSANLLASEPERSQPGQAKIQRHSANRPGSVLNEAQIASIRARLKFTPEQDRMWPAVEAALRSISYEKGAFARTRSARDGDRIVYIDLDGPEVQQLKAVALPLIMRLSEDQKREVKSLAHVMGLDGIADSF
jgi:hypothetical protein